MKTCKERAAWYLTPNLLIPFGGDFAFKDASAKFAEMDQIVAYVNSHSDVSFAETQLHVLGMQGENKSYLGVRVCVPLYMLQS